MTVGTAIVVSVGIICSTLICLSLIGACIQIKKNQAASNLTKKLTDEISAKIIANRDKK
jgi:hypothetical protein